MKRRAPVVVRSLQAVALFCAALACNAVDDAARPPAPPWGRLKVREILLAPPYQWVDASHCQTSPRRWVVAGPDATAMARVLTEAGLTTGDVARVLSATTCAPDGRCTAEPPDDVTRGLAPKVRQALYERLAIWPENEFATAPFVIPASHRDWWLDNEGLTPALHDLVSQLVYEHDEMIFFADMVTVCRAARSDEERIGVVRTFWSIPSRMVWLRLDKTSNVNRIADWWEHGLRRKSARSLMKSLIRDDGETLLDLVHLLPPVPRKLLYTYPTPGSPARDCGWTACNFYEERANDSFLSPEKVTAFINDRTVATDFDERRFGDILLFSLPDGTVVHFAVVLAEDLLFTKNGYTEFQPWRIITLEEIQREYARAPRVLVRRPR